MGTYEIQYFSRLNKLSLWFIAAHIPILMGLTYFFKFNAPNLNSDLLTTLIISCLTLSGPLLCYAMNKYNVLTSSSIGISAVSLSALLIHISGGMIEMHFHIFVMLALLICFGSPIVLIAAAAVVAVHHIAFFFFLPASVFNYEASFWIVLLHATFVIIQVVPSCFIAHKYRKFICAQDILLSDVSRFASNIFSQLIPLTNASTVLQRGSQEQLIEVNKSNDFLVKVGFQSQNNLAQAKSARDSTSKACDEANASLQQLEKMDQIMASIDSSNQKVKQVVKTIEEIAFQTNLLALNAAVEAARAGEAGKGFAVVAEEVRNLSARSSHAVQETASQIQDMVNNNEAGLKLINNVIDSLKRITDSVRDADTLVEQITHSSTEQNNALQLIDQSINGITNITQEQVVNVQNSVEAIESINDEFEHLNVTLSSVTHMLR